jgi:hypothetical protein
MKRARTALSPGSRAPRIYPSALSATHIWMSLRLAVRPYSERRFRAGSANLSALRAFLRCAA